MKKLFGSVHNIVIRGDIAVFRNGGILHTYKLTPARLVRLSKIPGYFEGSGILGFSAYISNAAKTLGSVKSNRKAAAARENGKKGGRPKRK